MYGLNNGVSEPSFFFSPSIFLFEGGVINKKKCKNLGNILCGVENKTKSPDLNLEFLERQKIKI